MPEPAYPIAHLIEFRGVYDGWSIAVLKDGSLVNRWAGPDGTPRAGHRHRFEATETALAHMRAEAEDDCCPCGTCIETIGYDPEIPCPHCPTHSDRKDTP